MVERRHLAPKLSAWIRSHEQRNLGPPEIDSTNLDEIASNLPDYSVLQKQLLLLRALARRSLHPGAKVPVSPVNDFPLAWASNETELGFHLNTLVDRGLVRKHSAVADGTGVNVEITADGWGFLDERITRDPFSDQVFVAMSFSKDLFPVWEKAIAPAIRRSGYTPYRVDSEPHIDRIDVKIIADIRSSRFLIADVTEHKPGVYFEAGYAMGLGLPVIWTVQKDDLKNAHFDTRQYNHIDWNDEPDLEERLFNTIYAVIGKGPHPTID